MIGGQGSLIALQPVAEYFKMLLPGYVGNTPVALPKQVFRGIHGALEVIHHYRGYIETVIGAVKEHQGQPSFLDLQVMPEIGGFLGNRSQDAVYPGAQESGDPFLFELRLFVRLVNKHIIPVLIGHVLDAMYHRAEKVDLRAGNDHPNDIGTARPERVGDPVTVIVHPLSSILHKLTGTFTGTLAVIQCPGYCRSRKIQFPGYISYGYFLAHHLFICR